MMEFEGNELIGLLFKSFVIVFSLGIIALPLTSARIKANLSIFVVAVIALVTSYLAIIGFSGYGIEYIINGGTFFGDIPLRIDALSSWFILIINFTSITGVLYGTGYLKTTSGSASLLTFHWILYIIFQTSMILVTIVQHSIVFIVVWELMSLSSFLLILFDYTNPKVIKAGMNYLVQMHISVILLTVAFIWVYALTGTFDFKGIGTFFGFNTNIWLFLIFLAGFGLKAGFIGLHTWLPQAHPAAPSHISGVMSGVIVKLGIYGLFRIITLLKSDYVLLGNIVITISILTGLFGIMNAAVHRDYKKMLAYCTIENIGIIGIGTGLGLIGMGRGHGLLVFFGFGGALLHVLNHSLFKSLLFYASGSVYSQTHTRDMDKLGGLIKTMPHSAILFLTGAIAIGGVPPLNGFISEFLIYSGILQGMSTGGITGITLMILTFAGLSLVGGLSLLTFTKTFGTMFLGLPRQKFVHEPVEVSRLMLFPQYLTLSLMLAVAFFPGLFIALTGKIVTGNIYPEVVADPSSLANFISILKKISIISVLFIAATGLIFFIRWYFSRRAKKEKSSTWGCAYVAPSEKMQYTGKSYSKSFGKLLNFLMIEKKGYTEITEDEIFPEQRKYHSFYLDIIEAKIIDPILQLITRFINLFQFIQNGRIQAYVIYGLVFILVVFIGTLLNFWH